MDKNCLYLKYYFVESHYSEKGLLLNMLYQTNSQ